MSLIRITSIDDSRLTPFRQLKHSNLTRWSGQFIAEGRFVVERLLQSRLITESVLISERQSRLLEDLPIPVGTPVLAVSADLARELTGFTFHAGVMACGRRGEPGSATQLLALSSPAATERQVIVGCPRMTDPDNLGGLIRLCRAFGVTGLLLGPACCDPFSRRTLRVSMGNAFDLPIIESEDLGRDLQCLKVEGGYSIAATVLATAAIPLHTATPLAREILLLGNEAQGLEAEWIECADRLITIPMQGGTDSLNVTVAAGICLHWLLQAAPTPTMVPDHGRTGTE